MLIDRADRIINLCEVKFSLSEYTITKDYDRKLRDRLQTFLDVVHPKKAIHQTFITTYKEFLYFMYFVIQGNKIFTYICSAE